MSTKQIKARLEYLRRELRSERISYGELNELQALAEHIPADDVELREAAGLPEQETETGSKWHIGQFVEPKDHKIPRYAGWVAYIYTEGEYLHQTCIAQVRAETILKSDCEANARLIAAAPDLLEACKALLEYVDFIRKDEPALSGKRNDNLEIKQVRAILARIEKEGV